MEIGKTNSVDSKVISLQFFYLEFLLKQLEFQSFRESGIFLHYALWGCHFQLQW